MTGDFFIGDVGGGRVEEISFQSASSLGGENYGWRVMEGSECFDPPTGCNSTGLFELPILEYRHDVGCAVIGGYRYRGATIPQLNGVSAVRGKLRQRTVSLYRSMSYGLFCPGTI